MSKYQALWEYIKTSQLDQLPMSYEEIDHSFLTYKKELLEYGYQVKKIKMKEKTIIFEKIK